MSYQLEHDETEARALRRSTVEQLDRAIAELTDGVKSDPVDAVHNARKSLKKARSVLRLARGGLRTSERRAANVALRDAGRRLSGARDAEVMIQAVDDLSKRYAGQLPRATFAAVKKHFQAQAAVGRQSLTAHTGEVADELRSARTRLAALKLRRDGWPAIASGLERSYRRGRKAYRRAEGKPTIENLHDWRKRAKDLWYQARLLEPVSPGLMHGYAKEAHELADLLGDDHDLAVLRETLRAGADTIPTDVDSVLTLVDHRRDQLQAEALHVGARLYAEKPKAFTRRMRSYWKVWRSDAPAAAEEPVHLRGRVATGTA